MAKKTQAQNKAKSKGTTAKKNQAKNKANTGEAEKKKQTREATSKKTKEMVIRMLTNGFTCKMCGKRFGAKFNLNKHSFLHKKKTLKCLNCGYVTNSPYMLSFHQKKCIEGKKFECPTCGETFAHRMQVYRHQKKFH